MFFVLSSGRSGSRTSSSVFSQYENCVCLHHPEPELVVEATRYYYGELPGETIADILRQTRQPEVDGKIYGEVNLQLSLLFPVLRQVFPAAQYVWLLRDGRDAVASMYYRGWYDTSNTRIPAEWHAARLQGDRTGDFSSQQWQGLSRFAKCCWIWRKYNEIIEQHLGTLDPPQWCQVHLERFRAEGPGAAATLGLRGAGRMRVEKQNVAFQPVTAWEQWTDEQRQAFAEMCGPWMDRWYPEWKDDAGHWQRIDSEKPDAPPLTVRLRELLRAGYRKVRTVAGRR